MPLDLKLRNEDAIQAEIVRWSYAETKNQPDLWLLHHCPNGGFRGMQAGMRFKALGVKAGVPDVVLPVPRGKYYGLWIEVKTATGKVSDSQKEWHERLTKIGHFVVVIRTAEEGIETIKQYLNL